MLFCDSLKIKIEQKRKIGKSRNSRYIYENELDKACFQHDMVYGDSKGLSRRAFTDKVLHDKGFNIAKDRKYGGCQRCNQLFINFEVYKF